MEISLLFQRSWAYRHTWTWETSNLAIWGKNSENHIVQRNNGEVDAWWRIKLDCKLNEGRGEKVLTFSSVLEVTIPIPELKRDTTQWPVPLRQMALDYESMLANSPWVPIGHSLCFHHYGPYSLCTHCNYWCAKLPTEQLPSPSQRSENWVAELLSGQSKDGIKVNYNQVWALSHCPSQLWQTTTVTPRWTVKMRQFLS